MMRRKAPESQTVSTVSRILENHDPESGLEPEAGLADTPIHPYLKVQQEYTDEGPVEAKLALESARARGGVGRRGADGPRPAPVP